uniref:Uncharacterized protein n=1 Tax=Setaria viridis TaxID=4556 RepID=A0A4U6WE79_SETVI|nr:hypothetical protein SEVIR_1G246150v2 [Setaria viridis]
MRPMLALLLLLLQPPACPSNLERQVTRGRCLFVFLTNYWIGESSDVMLTIWA